MPQYKLTYYDIQGLAEPARYMFAVAGVEYEDDRIPKDETTYPKLPASIKDGLPWGNIPVLEVDDGKHKIAQSGSILRFLAKRLNLNGADEFEAAKCDEISEAMNDFGKDWQALMKAPDAEKPEKLKNLTEVSIPHYMGKFNEIASKNGKWFVGKNISWADIKVAHYLNMGKKLSPIQFIDKYPAVEKLMEDVFSHPAIKAWIAKRPDTD